MPLATPAQQIVDLIDEYNEYDDIPTHRQIMADIGLLVITHRDDLNITDVPAAAPTPARTASAGASGGGFDGHYMNPAPINPNPDDDDDQPDIPFYPDDGQPDIDINKPVGMSFVHFTDTGQTLFKLEFPGDELED